MFGDQTCHNFFGGHVRKILHFHSVLLKCEKRGEVFRERGVNRNDTVIYSFLYATSWQTALILLLSNILITIIANEKSHWKPNFVLIVRLAEEWYVQFSGRVSRITKPKRSNIGCEESKLLKTAFFVSKDMALQIFEFTWDPSHSTFDIPSSEFYENSWNLKEKHVMRTSW